MRTKEFKNCAAALGLFVLLASSASAIPPLQTHYSSGLTVNESVTSRASYTEWRYKTENGKLYKRLYNTFTYQWVGDWIYVCDV